MKIGFIGCGNMGSALARAVAKANEAELMLCDTDLKRAQALARELGGTVADAQAVGKACKFVFIGVKPYAVSEVLTDLEEALSENADAVVVSMAAATDLFTLKRQLTEDRAVIRIMPNTPAAIGEGVVAFASSGVGAQDITGFKRIMAGCGIVDEIPERLIDAESALAGCGPAFAYMFIEALSDGAVRCGLPRDVAIKYAAATLKGAADMVLCTGEHPGALKDAVCSPGGSTIEGVLALEEAGFRSAAAEAVIAAYEKTKKMAK